MQDGTVLPPWTPDLASLDLLLGVARTGSIARAAEEHGLSQPSASTRLSRLERRLGVALLVRATSGTTLTPTGEAVAAWAADVVAAAHQLTDGVSALRAIADARLSVAASQSTAYEGAALLAVYSLGLGVPFLLAGIAVGPFLTFFDTFKKHLGTVEKVMGGLLVVTGVLFLTGNFTRLSYWFLETFPVLSQFG